MPAQKEISTVRGDDKLACADAWPVSQPTNAAVHIKNRRQ